MSLLSESLLAHTGLRPKKITPSQITAAADFAEKVRKRIRAWVSSEETAPFPFVEPPDDLDEWFDALVKPPAELEVAGWIEQAGDPGLGAEYVIDMQRARAYVVQAWPRTTVQGFAAPKVQPLAFDESAEVWSVLSVVDKPSRLLDEIEATTISPSQAAAFRECFPELYRFVMGDPERPEERPGALREAIAEKLAADLQWEPPPEKEAVMRTLAGQPPEVPLEPPPLPPAKPKKLDLDTEDVATQGDVSGAPKGQKKK